MRQGSFLEVEPGVEVYYEDSGEGTPLVFVPGWTFSTEVFDQQVAQFSNSRCGGQDQACENGETDQARETTRSQARRAGERKHRIGSSQKRRDDRHRQRPVWSPVCRTVADVIT